MNNPLLQPEKPDNGGKNKYTVRRFIGDSSSPYLPYAHRCQFAVETMQSLAAPIWHQQVELELLYNTSGEEEDEDGY